MTANKQVIANTGAELLDVAATHRRHLLFEAAVAGGVPIIRAVREGLAGDRLCRVAGVLNGTCNYILTRMEADPALSFDAVLAEAQQKGYAEADPTADVDGGDAGAKLAILAAVGLKRRFDASAIPLRSIRPVEPIDFVYARRLDSTIRQVSHAELVNGADDDRVTASVQPMLVPIQSPMARAEGEPERRRGRRCPRRRDGVSRLRGGRESHRRGDRLRPRGHRTHRQRGATHADTHAAARGDRGRFRCTAVHALCRRRSPWHHRGDRPGVPPAPVELRLGAAGTWLREVRRCHSSC